MSEAMLLQRKAAHLICGVDECLVCAVSLGASLVVLAHCLVSGRRYISCILLSFDRFLIVPAEMPVGVTGALFRRILRIPGWGAHALFLTLKIES